MARQKEQEDSAETTREEIGKGNQMTALRFQTGGKHQTSPASLRGEEAGGGGGGGGWGGGGRDRQTDRDRETEKHGCVRCEWTDYSVTTLVYFTT